MINYQLYQDGKQKDIKNTKFSRAWWCTPLTPALGKQKQEDL